MKYYLPSAPPGMTNLILPPNGLMTLEAEHVLQRIHDATRSQRQKHSRQSRIRSRYPMAGLWKSSVEKIVGQSSASCIEMLEHRDDAQDIIVRFSDKSAIVGKIYDTPGDIAFFPAPLLVDKDANVTNDASAWLDTFSKLPKLHLGSDIPNKNHEILTWSYQNLIQDEQVKELRSIASIALRFFLSTHITGPSNDTFVLTISSRNIDRQGNLGPPDIKIHRLHFDLDEYKTQTENLRSQLIGFLDSTISPVPPENQIRLSSKMDFLDGSECLRLMPLGVAQAVKPSEKSAHERIESLSAWHHLITGQTFAR